MKPDGKPDRNWLKDWLGDAIHAILCSAGYNIRLLLPRLFYTLVLVWLASGLDENTVWRH